MGDSQYMESTEATPKADIDSTLLKIFMGLEVEEVPSCVQRQLNHAKEAKHHPKWPKQLETVWRLRGMRGMHQKLSSKRALYASEVGS